MTIVSKEEDRKKEKAKFPLKGKPNNPANTQVTMKEYSAWTCDSAEGALTAIMNFKEIVIAIPVLSLMQDRTAGGQVLSELNQENGYSAI